jgi:hypothetical protein
MLYFKYQKKKNFMQKKKKTNLWYILELLLRYGEIL